MRVCSPKKLNSVSLQSVATAARAICNRMPSLHLLINADKQVFPKLDIVGWYATGEEIQDADMAIHKKVQSSMYLVFVGCVTFGMTLRSRANVVVIGAGYGAQ